MLPSIPFISQMAPSPWMQILSELIYFVLGVAIVYAIIFQSQKVREARGDIRENAGVVITLILLVLLLLGLIFASYLTRWVVVWW